MTLTETNRTWTPDRIEEFKMLNGLLIELRQINGNAKALERIAKCIAIAEELSMSNVFRESFTDFLREVVCEQIQAE